MKNCLFKLFAGLLFLGLSGSVMGQSISINSPYVRQSAIHGSQIPVTVTVAPASGQTITQVDIYTVTGGAFSNSLTPAATSTTTPFVTSIRLPSTGATVDIYAKLTQGNGTTLVTASSRTINLIASTACNSGTAVKTFYVQAGAPTTTGTSANSLGQSASVPTGSFNKLMSSGVAFPGSATVFRPLPGDIIYIMDGVSGQSYTLPDPNASNNLFTMVRTGTPNCPITITKAPGSNPKLKLPTTVTNGILVPIGVSYINISELEIEGNNATISQTDATNQPGSCATPSGTASANFNSNGVTIDGLYGGTTRPHHISLTKLNVHDLGASGIKVLEADYLTIDNNKVYNNGWWSIYGGSGILLSHLGNFDNTTGYRNYVRNNTAYNNRNYVPQLGSCNLTQGNGIVLDDFKNTQASSTIQTQVYTGRTLVANNLLYNNGGSGVHSFRSVKADIVNNTAYQNSQTQGANTPIGEVYAQESEDVNLVNNIIQPLAGERTFTTETGNTAVAYTNNLYLVTTAGTQIPTAGGGTTVSNNVVTVPASETATFVNSTTNTATANFQLGQAGAAINAGVSTFAASVTGDIVGTARPQGSAVDLGAYEALPITITQQPASASSVCTGGAVSVSVTTSSPAGYQWYKDGVALTGVASATTANLSLSSISAGDLGTYSVVATGVNTLTSTAFVLTERTPPTITLAPQSATLSCVNKTVVLEASGGNSYTFSAGTPNSNSVTISVAGTYTVTGADVSGCLNTATALVENDNSIPVVSLAPSSGTLSCSVASITLTASNANSYTFSGGTTLGADKIVVDAPGTYSVTATGVGGCTSTASVTIDGDTTPPTALLTPASATLTCTNQSLTLTASGGATYAFDGGTALGVDKTVVNAVGTYSVTVTGANGCTNVASATIDQNTVQPSVTITPNPSLTVTTGSNVTLTASGTAGNTYLWSTNATSASIVVNTANTYSVTATGANGCTASASATVTTVANPGISFKFPHWGLSSFPEGTSIVFLMNTSTPAGTTVSKVEFFHRTTNPNSAFTKIGEDLTAPYTMTWTAANNTNEIRAVITNSVGGTAAASSFPASLSAGTVSNKIYYVSDGLGLNSNNGLSTSTPFKTLQKAAEMVLPGDIVYVMAGTYSNTLVCSGGCNTMTLARTGLPNAPILFKNYQNDKPKIVFDAWQGITIGANVAYVTIDGIEIEGMNQTLSLSEALTQPGTCISTAVSGTLTNLNSPSNRRPGTFLGKFNGNGLTVEGRDGSNQHPHHITIKNCKIHDCPGAGMQAIEGDYITFENNEVYNNSWYTFFGTSGMSIFHPWNYDNNTSVYRNIVRNNRSYNNRLLVPWTYGSCKKYDGNGIIMDDFMNTQASAIQGQLYGGRSLVYNNLVFNNGGSGMHAFKSLHVDFVFNTSYKNSETPDSKGEIFVQASDDMRVLNNVVQPMDGEGVNEAFTGGNANTNMVSDYNVYLVTNPAQVEIQGTNDLLADPLFVNPSLDATVANFQLQPNSPAINSGVASFSTLLGGVISVSDVVTNDFLNVARPQGSGYDRGAYELVGSPISITAQPAASSAVCVGVPVSVSVGVSGMVQGYQWYKDGTALTGISSATTATLSLPAVTTANAGNYSVVITGFNNLTSNAFSLTVNAPPTATLTPSSATLTCAVTSATLTASGGTGYSFSGGTALGSDKIIVSSAGSYSVLVTDANGCTAATSASVVSETGAASVSIAPISGTLTCTIRSVSLSAIGSGTVVWSTGASTSVISATATGTYTVTITNANGCTATASVSVTANQTAPMATLTPSSATLTCANPSLTLTASGGSSYAFSGGAALGSDKIVVTSANTYSVIVTGANGCTAVASAIIESSGNPSGGVSLGAIPANLAVCEGGTVRVPVAFTGNPTSFQWYRNGALVSGQISATLALGGVQMSQAGSYVLVATAGCTTATSSTLNLTVGTVTPSVVIAFPNGSTVVVNNSVPTITIPAGVEATMVVSGGASYERTCVMDQINGFEIRAVDSNTTGILPIKQSGLFRLTITGANGCQKTVSGNVIRQ